MFTRLVGYEVVILEFGPVLFTDHLVIFISLAYFQCSFLLGFLEG